MNEADRVVAAREKSALAERAQREQATRLATRDRRLAAWREIVALTQPALAALERQGWPGGGTVNVKRKTLFGRLKPAPKAGWELTTYRFPFKDTSAECTVHVLSDGRLARTGLGGPTVLEGMYLDFILDAEAMAWRDFPFYAVKRGLERLAAGTTDAA